MLSQADAGPSTQRKKDEKDGVNIIAHDRGVQVLMDKMNIAWGTQYEIARGVSDGRWNWSDVTPQKLKRLRGNNLEVASTVEAVLLAKDARRTNLDLW